MLGKLQNIEVEKQDMVSHINECINAALEDMEFDRRVKQKFLRAYIARLRGDESG